MAAKKLRLFVWENVLTDYTDGMMFAVAKNVEEARKKIKETCSYVPDNDLAKNPVEVDLTQPSAFLCWGGG